MDRKVPRLLLRLSGGSVALLLALAPASARHSQDKDPDLERVGQIASQPVRDVGLARSHIPEPLQDAAADPYAAPARKDCAWLNWELAQLNEALGPDFDDSETGNDDKVGRIAFAGGEMLVNSLIPFRGLVREISGAAPAERRKAAAISAGVARRGYLRGLAAARRCARPLVTASK